jgi:hypothetical protein
VIRVLVRGIATAIALSVIRTMLRGGRAGRRAAGEARAQVAGLEYEGFRRAAGGDGLSLAISAGLATLRNVRRMGQRKREVVWTGALTPGQKLVVRHLLEDRKGRSAG